MQQLKFPICVNCGSFVCKVHHYCDHCFRRFVTSKMSLKQSQYDHYFIFDWKIENQLGMDQLVYRMKGSQSPKSLEFYSRQVAAMILTSNAISKVSWVVPIPSSRFKWGHSEILASNLANSLGLRYCRALEKRPSMQSKHLNKAERSLENPFKLTPESVEITTPEVDFDSKMHKILFVDDVLTTGTSFQHCKNALGGHLRSFCLTLFYREKHEGQRSVKNL